MSNLDEPTPQRRVFTRIPFEADVVLALAATQHVCSLVDISLKGALVDQSQAWNASMGDPCILTITLANEGPAIEMKGEIAHLEQGRLGMRCTEIDLESMTNLRRLVELNLGDKAILNREIQAMVADVSKAVLR